MTRCRLPARTCASPRCSYIMAKDGSGAGRLSRICTNSLRWRPRLFESRTNKSWLRCWPPPQMMESADGRPGFAPLAMGAFPARVLDWAPNERDRDLGRRGRASRRGSLRFAVAPRWDASRDIPWSDARGLPDFLERAVCQIVTFIAQNEYAAYYVPARSRSKRCPSWLPAPCSQLSSQRGRRMRSLCEDAKQPDRPGPAGRIRRCYRSGPTAAGST